MSFGAAAGHCVAAAAWAQGIDAGARQLLTGLAQALTGRATIQQAIGVLMARNDRNAAETGNSLTDTATALLDGAATPHSHPES